MKYSPVFYWGGDFAAVVKLLNCGQLDLQKIKFFVGYSGWSSGQLEGELNEKSWILSSVQPAHPVLRKDEQEIWRQSLAAYGAQLRHDGQFPDRSYVELSS